METRRETSEMENGVHVAAAQGEEVQGGSRDPGCRFVGITRAARDQYPSLFLLNAWSMEKAELGDTWGEPGCLCMQVVQDEVCG